MERLSPQEKPALENSHGIIPEEFIPLSLIAFNLLLSLSDGERRHGYAILKDIQGFTHNRPPMYIGSLYRNLETLYKEGLIEETDNPDYHQILGMPRATNFYQITPLGREVTQLELQRVQGLLNVAKEKGILPDDSSHSQ